MGGPGVPTTPATTDTPTAAPKPKRKRTSKAGDDQNTAKKRKSIISPTKVDEADDDHDTDADGDADGDVDANEIVTPTKPKAKAMKKVSEERFA